LCVFLNLLKQIIKDALNRSKLDFRANVSYVKLYISQVRQTARINFRS